MIQTIFFDFGRVLADFDHRRATTRLLEYTDLPNEAALHAVLYAHEWFDELEAGRRPTTEYIDYVYAKAGLRCDRSLFRTIFGDIFTPIRTMCELIPKLKGRYRVVLASNTNELHANHFLKEMRTTFDHFDHLVLSHQAGARKPEADFYRRCQDHARCSPAECLFIDDRLDNIAAAAKHGWQTIPFTGFESLIPQLGGRGIAVR